MEEGEDGPAAEKSPLERDAATLDLEGSVEHDASSPSVSERESHHGDRGLPMVSPCHGDGLCHWSTSDHLCRV